MASTGLRFSHTDTKTFELFQCGDHAMKRLNFIKAENLDRQFDEGQSVLEHFDLKNIRRPGLETKRVNVDFPMWMIASLDKEAQRLGINRQAVIKTWIAQLLEEKTA